MSVGVVKEDLTGVAGTAFVVCLIRFLDLANLLRHKVRVKRRKRD